jgi:hypothetical protein
MDRRAFLYLLGAAPAAAQQGPPREERVERMTAPATQTIALCHAGFLARAPKVLLVRNPANPAPAEFTLRNITDSRKFKPRTFPLKPVQSDFGPHLAGDFSSVEDEGYFQIDVGAQRSVPFWIRPDVWRRLLPLSLNYIHSQRCGVAVPNVHPVCHLDDARRRDNNEYVDTTGGWHDAGDLRKWMSATMMNGFALCHMARNLGEQWNADASGLAPLLDEMRWGNRYFLKMQTSEGWVWSDVGGGVNGDNSDNHWTDNQTGTSDDRYINVSRNQRIQAMWCCLQALVAQVFRKSDPGYARQCLAAGLRCWNANAHAGDSGTLAWWTLAALEFCRATRSDEFRKTTTALANQLLAFQVKEHERGQKQVRGYWRISDKSPEPYASATDSALPPYALLEAVRALGSGGDAAKWLDAVRLHVEDYILPITSRSAYRILPYGLFTGSPTPERYRPLAGELTYRYFLPVRKQFWWQGLNAHLACGALFLFRASQQFAKPEWRDLGFRQIEWTFGANPFAACLMTGEGSNHPYPYSRFVGLLPGGIVNGIAGNVDDEPILDTTMGFDWRTLEYWSPHVAYFAWAVSVL